MRRAESSYSRNESGRYSDESYGEDSMGSSWDDKYRSPQDSDAYDTQKQGSRKEQNELENAPERELENENPETPLDHTKKRKPLENGESRPTEVGAKNVTQSRESVVATTRTTEGNKLGESSAREESNGKKSRVNSRSKMGIAAETEAYVQAESKKVGKITDPRTGKNTENSGDELAKPVARETLPGSPAPKTASTETVRKPEGGDSKSAGAFSDLVKRPDESKSELREGSSDGISKNDRIRKKVENTASLGSEKSASRSSDSIKDKKLGNFYDVDKQKVKNVEEVNGTDKANQVDMRLARAYEPKENSDITPKAFERPGMQVNAKDVEISPRKSAASTRSKHTTNAAKSAEGSEISRIAANVSRNVETAPSDSFKQLDEVLSRPFDVQVSREVGSNRPADAVKAVQQAFSQIAEAQPSKMRFTLNMANGERVEIQVVQRDGGLHVRLAAQSSELREALTRSWDSLTQSAHNKGIKLVPPVIDTLPPNTPQQFDKGNNPQQQSAGDRPTTQQESRGDRQETPDQTRERESFREAFRENLREHAQRRQATHDKSGDPKQPKR